MTLEEVVFYLNQEKTVDIIVISNSHSCGRKRSRYTWAWRESAEKGVFGCADSLEEIKTRAERMFPGTKLVLFLL